MDRNRLNIALITCGAFILGGSVGYWLAAARMAEIVKEGLR